MDISIYIYTLLNCLYLGVCLLVSNKRQKGWTDRAQILFGTIPGKGYGTSKLKKKIQKNSSNFFWKCANSKKIISAKFYKYLKWQTYKLKLITGNPSNSDLTRIPLLIGYTTWKYILGRCYNFNFLLRNWKSTGGQQSDYRYSSKQKGVPVLKSLQSVNSDYLKYQKSTTKVCKAMGL